MVASTKTAGRELSCKSYKPGQCCCNEGHSPSQWKQQMFVYDSCYMVVTAGVSGPPHICPSSETQKGDKWPHKTSAPRGRDSTGLSPASHAESWESSVDGFYRLRESCFTTVTILELVWKQGFVLQADEGRKARESISYMICTPQSRA